MPKITPYFTEEIDTDLISYAKNRTKKLKKKLVERYWFIVVQQAKIMFKGSIPVEELASYGSEGLMQAVDRFDPTKGIPFQAYCTQRIVGSIKDGIRDNSPYSRSAATKQAKLNKHINRLQNHFNRPISLFDVGRLAGLPDSEMTTKAYRYQIPDISSLDYSDPENEHRAEFIIDKMVPDPSLSVSICDWFEEVCKHLNKKEAAIIKGFYCESKHMVDIAKDLGICESGAYSIHRIAINKLKDILSQKPQLMEV